MDMAVTDPTLDKQVRELIQRAVESGTPSIYTLPIVEARAAYRERYERRGVLPVEIDDVREISIPSPSGSVTARLYDPCSAGHAPLPIIVYFHGGGFVLGDIESYDAQSRLLAARTGWLVLVPTYRLAPEHRFPAAVDDAWTVVNWTWEHAQHIGADSTHIVVAGDSAGGNLAAVVAHAGVAKGRRLRGQLLIYPVTDYTSRVPGGHAYDSEERFAKGYFLDREVIQWLSSHYLPSTNCAWDRRASPLLAQDVTNLASAIIITAGHDPLRDMGVAYAHRLSAAGVPVFYRCFDSLIHNFLGFAGVIDAAQNAFDQIVDDVKRIFSPQIATIDRKTDGS